VPHTFLGWVFLVVVALIVFVGWTQAGHDVHSWITGALAFAHAVAGH
jgi:hypothetical protein